MNNKKIIIIFIIIIVLIVTGIFIFKKFNPKNEEPKKNGENIMTKDEAYRYLKDFYVEEETDIITFVKETKDEYVFELKGSCNFLKCEYFVNKKTKEVINYIEDKE